MGIAWELETTDPHVGLEQGFAEAALGLSRALQGSEPAQLLPSSSGMTSSLRHCCPRTRTPVLPPSSCYPLAQVAATKR